MLKAVVYDQPEQFTVTDVETPEPGPGEVRVRITRTGVCGTDLHLHDGEFGPTYPLTPGHEMLGTVDAVGAGVDGWPTGRQVIVDNAYGDHTCVECRRGFGQFCTGVVAHGVNAPGGFAEFVVLPAAQLHDADGLDPDLAVFAEPLACVVHGVDVLDLRPGSSVCIIGAGPTGILLAQMLRHCGASTLVVSAPTQFKLDIAARTAGAITVQADRNDPEGTTARLLEHAPDGYDVVVDATGAVPVMQQAMSLVRTGGTIFLYGMPRESAQWPVPAYEVFRRELTIKGSYSQDAEFDRAIAWLRSGAIDTSDMITARFGLDEYDRALAAAADSAVLKAVVIPG